MDEIVALSIKVQGRVQGVNYRAFTRRQALNLGLRGFVRNLPDRSVEVHAEGEKQQLERLLDILRKGPSAARVDNIETDWLESTGKYQDFLVVG